MKINKNILRLFLLGIMMILFQPVLAAQDTHADSLVVYDKADSSIEASKGLVFSEPESINIPMLVGKMVFYLTLIVGMIFGVIYFLKNFIYKRNEMFTKDEIFKVITSTHIAPKRTLMLVESVNKLLVLAVTDTAVNLITELDREEYDEYMKSNNPAGGNPGVEGNQFKDMFNAVLKRKK